MEANDSSGAHGTKGLQQLLWVNGLIAQQIPNNRVGVDTHSYSPSGALTNFRIGSHLDGRVVKSLRHVFKPYCSTLTVYKHWRAKSGWGTALEPSNLVGRFN